MQVYVVCEQPLFRLSVSELIKTTDSRTIIGEVESLEALVNQPLNKPFMVICCGRAADPLGILKLINNTQVQAEQIVLFSASLGCRHRRLLGRGVNLILPMSVNRELANNYLRLLLLNKRKAVWRLAQEDEELISGFLPDSRDLTGAERCVLVNLNKGLSNEDIASNLGIRVSTVKVHLARACRKLGAKNRTAAVTLFGSVLAVNC